MKIMKSSKRKNKSILRVLLLLWNEDVGHRDLRVEAHILRDYDIVAFLQVCEMLVRSGYVYRRSDRGSAGLTERGRSLLERCRMI